MPDENKQPTWQPISQLPLLAAMVKGILENTEEQHQIFLEVADKPHVLDDALVQRAQRLYRTQLADADLYEAKAERWLQGQLTCKQHQAVEALLTQVSRIRDLSQKILALLVGLVLAAVLVSGDSNSAASITAGFFIDLGLGILIQPFVAVVITLLYLDLRVRKEGLDLTRLAHELGADASGGVDPVDPPWGEAPPPPGDDPS